MSVGSECVVNYKKAFASLYGKNLRLIFPKKYRNFVEKFNEKNPGIAECQNIPDIDIKDHREADYLEIFADDEFEEEYDRISDLTPEGLGDDEIDWDSLDYE